MPTRVEEKNPEPKEAKPSPPSQGGMSGWVVLGVNIALMPVLAYALTTYVLLPQIRKELGTVGVQARQSETSSAAHSAEKGSPAEGKLKNKVVLSKIIVNVSGSLGSRMLLASFTLAGNAADLKERVEENMDRLRDLAAGTLASKTIADLEKPEARNILRAELISQINAALGGNIVQEIYITELAIQ